MAEPAAAAPPMMQLDLNSTYGALFIGLLVSAILFGVTNLQVFFYLTTYTRDWIGHKIAVCWLWAMDALHLALISHVVYFYLVTNYADPLALVGMVWSFKLQIVIDVVVVLSVQTLYIIRLMKLNAGERKILTGIGAFLLMADYGVGIAQCWAMFTINSFAEVPTKIGWSSYVTLSTATAVDATIAFSLCYILAKRRTGFSKTDSAVEVLMVYTLNTGLLTSLCSITSIITYATKPQTFVFVAIVFLMTKLYINSYVAMLNARRYLGTRTGLSSRTTNDIELSTQEHSHISIPKLPKLQVGRFQATSPQSASPFIYPPSPSQYGLNKYDERDVDPSRTVEVTIEKEVFSQGAAF